MGDSGVPELSHHISKVTRARAVTDGGERVNKSNHISRLASRAVKRAPMLAADKNNATKTHRTEPPRVHFSPSPVLDKDFQGERATTAHSSNRVEVIGRSSSRLPLENQDSVNVNDELPEVNTRELSMLRRITTSPFPTQRDESARHETHGFSAPGRITDKHASQSTVVAAHEPLYMALSDALSRPNANHYLIPQQATRQPSHHSPTPLHSTTSVPIHEHDDEDGKAARASSPIISNPRLYNEFLRQERKIHAAGMTLGRNISSIDSGLSLLSDNRRFSDCDTSISGAAEELFKNISNSCSIPDISSNHSSTDISGPISPDDGEQFNRKSTHEAPSSLMNPQDITATVTPLTWRETLTEDAYKTLIAHYDIFEMRRQEVIWELSKSEEEFVNILQLILALFIQPLRTENETRWIPGLDPDVAKLFDWLDDIAQLHTEVLSIMRGCRINQVRIILI